MHTYYYVDQNGLQEVNEDKANFFLIRDNSESTYNTFIRNHKLPGDIFDWTDLLVVAPRFEKIDFMPFQKTAIVSLVNIENHSTARPVEERLESVVFILLEDKLYCFVSRNSQLDDDLINQYGPKIDDLQSVIVYSGIILYKNFLTELEYQKDRIEHLDKNVRSTKINQELEALADTKADMVILENVLDLLEECFSNLLRDESFTAIINDAMLIYDIKLYNRQVNKLVHVYKESLDNVSDLIVAMMNNRLNVLMKIMSSISIILATASMVGSFFGINTAGLPFLHHEHGSLIVFIIMVLMCALVAWWLKRNDL